MSRKITASVDSLYIDEVDEKIILVEFSLRNEKQKLLATGLSPLPDMDEENADLFWSMREAKQLEYLTEELNKRDFSKYPVISEASTATQVLIAELTQSGNNMLFMDNDPNEDNNLDILLEKLPKGQDWISDIQKDIAKFDLASTLELVIDNSENPPIAYITCYSDLQTKFLRPEQGVDLKKELASPKKLKNIQAR